jgi:ABC-type sugar transport system substrate-binding protein
MEPHGRTPKHPDIIVTLTGEDGNALATLGRCRAAARDAGLSDDEITAFMADASAGDCDHLLQTAMRWFETTQDARASP